MQRQLSPQVMTLIRAGRTIDAIKHLRKETGLGLKEAKHQVDEAMDDYQASNPNFKMSQEGSVWPLVLAFLLGALVYHLYLNKGF